MRIRRPSRAPGALADQSGAMAKRNETSAEQPVSEAVCVITHDASMPNIKGVPDLMLDMLLSLRAAVNQNPDVIVVCLPRCMKEGQGAQRGDAHETSLLLEALCKELKNLEAARRWRSRL